MRFKTVGYGLLILALSILPACVPPAIIGGSINGLTGEGLVLQNNGVDNLTVAAGSTQFTFATSIASGGSYAVTILTQPQGGICTVSNGSGTVANINISTVTINCVANLSGSNLAVFAGNMGGSGSADGTGSAARFYGPHGVATDSVGNIYVGDVFNFTIRKITPAGVVTTFAGTAGKSGSADGIGASARFLQPMGVATDSAGNVYVADYGNCTIRKITPAGVVTTLAGTAGKVGYADGIGAWAGFNYPEEVATDRSGNVYVAEQSNTIRKITPAGVVTTLVGTAGNVGYVDGIGVAARFSSLIGGIAIDGVGNIFVTDTGNRTIRKIDPAGVVTTLAGTPGTGGSTDGTGTAALFDQPYGVSLDSAGNVYVAELQNRTIRKITPAGVVTTLAGTAGTFGSTDGTGTSARFDFPEGLATDSGGFLYVADSANNTIRKITPAGVVSTLAGQAAVVGNTDGTGAAASFISTVGVAADNVGNVFVTDTNGIRKITPAGVVTTLAGMTRSILGIPTYGSTDGTGIGASFYDPKGIATDSAGNIYVADTWNHTIRKVTQAGIVTTLAGTAGESGHVDGMGAAARFFFPTGIATDRAGIVYVADYGTGTIRMITPTGLVTTLAGAQGELYEPSGLALDSEGNVYVTNYGNNTISKITPTGVVSKLAGTAGVYGSADGFGAAASFNMPDGIATDSAGNVYVADSGNNTIRKVTAGGVVSTVVGVPGQNSFVAGALPGGLSSPRGVAISGTSLYITTAQGVAVVKNLP